MTVLVAIVALAAIPASAGAFEVVKWEAGTCYTTTCEDKGSHSEFYTQAAGHPPYGITDFRFASKKLALLEIPEGHVKDVRVDLPVGLAVNPEAVPTCSQAQIEVSACPPESQVGVDEAVGAAGGIAIKESFPAYNMERKPGQSALVGVEVKSAALTLLKLESIIYLEGSLSWHHESEAPGGESSGVATGDYHEYFRIHNIPKEPELIESRLIFWGVPFEKNGGLPGTDNAFITMPSTCNGPQITVLHVDSYEEEGHFQRYSNETPVGATGCESLEFKPQINQKPETNAEDAANGTEVVVNVPQYTSQPSRPDTPDVLETKATLPEGMTLNPSAANGLEACGDSQFKIGTDEPIECPAKSIIGTVAVDAPGIPNGSMTGHVYLGAPKSTEPVSGQEYRILVAAEAPAYDVGVRLEGRVSANSSTGRLSTTFSNLPPVPFEDFALKFDGGPTAPLANPLACGTTSAIFSSYSGQTANPTSPFAVQLGNVMCAPPPFSLSQSSASSPSTAGSNASFTFDLTRPEGQQYLSTLATTLPAGLIGEIPAAEQCSEGQVAANQCPAASRIGTAEVSIGSGPSPYGLSGPVYLTGPYGGGPFGLAVMIDASHVGPYDYGLITTRAKIAIDPYTARVSVTSSLPTVIGGVPIRLRNLRVKVDRAGFMLNPTNCAPLATDTSITSTIGATGSVSSPFQVSGCEALPFKPAFKVTTKAHATRRYGASLRVTVTEKRGEADIASVAATLPKKLVARLATLKNACPQQTFAANPAACPADSRVGSVSVTTPVLPVSLNGPAYFVSHGGAAFPDLDLVLSGDGVTVVLVGNTNITADITHSDFGTLPDVPIDSFTLTLPQGPNSALAANGNLCQGTLSMPVTMIGQNGKRLAQPMPITVSGCPKVRHCGSHPKRRRHLRVCHKHARSCRHVKHARAASTRGKHRRHGSRRHRKHAQTCRRPIHHAHRKHKRRRRR